MHSEYSRFSLRLGAALILASVSILAPKNGMIPNANAQAQPADTGVAVRSPEQLRAILANQPNFSATVTACNSKRRTDTAVIGRLAKHGNTYRIETSSTLFNRGPRGTISLGQIVWIVGLGGGKDDEATGTALVPERKAYFTDGEDFDGAFMVAVLSSPYVSFLSPQWMEEICGLRDAGTDHVNGLDCQKIEVANRTGDLVVFYVAESLDNMVVRIVVRESPPSGFGGAFAYVSYKGAVIDLTDVKLDPPQTLFVVPSTYRRLSAPQLYMDEDAEPVDVPESVSGCAEPSRTGEVSRKELCEERTPLNKAPDCAGISTECGALHSGGSCHMVPKASDADGDVLTYTWKATGGRVVINRGEADFDATGLAPGSYVVTVSVNDGFGHTTMCSTTIVVLTEP